MSRTAEITKVVMFVETEGKAYLVNLPNDRKMLLCNMAASLSDSGALELIKLPDDFEFTTMGDLDK